MLVRVSQSLQRLLPESGPLRALLTTEAVRKQKLCALRILSFSALQLNIAWLAENVVDLR
jgi:hypothetical protein